MAGWAPPEGSAVRDSARALDPWAIAPKAGLAMALAGALAIGWALAAPSFAGEPAPAHLARFYFPSRWTPLGGLLAIMALGASKRCFGFGWPTLLGLGLGIGLPLLLAAHLGPEVLAGMGAALALAGFGLHSALARFRIWAAMAVGSLGVTLVTLAAVGWTMDPAPFDPTNTAQAYAAAWMAGGFGVTAGALIAFTGLRGRSDSPSALDSGGPPR
ncbi:MAG: hypothetical protein JJ863_29555 [Deltaproteobacteria bacterium]|nr:hypothetical protein [Deltaproteobacteria bacterium]